MISLRVSLIIIAAIILSVMVLISPAFKVWLSGYKFHRQQKKRHSKEVSRQIKPKQGLQQMSHSESNIAESEISTAKLKKPKHKRIKSAMEELDLSDVPYKENDIVNSNFKNGEHDPLDKYRQAIDDHIEKMRKGDELSSVNIDNDSTSYEHGDEEAGVINKKKVTNSYDASFLLPSLESQYVENNEDEISIKDETTPDVLDENESTIFSKEELDVISTRYLTTNQDTAFEYETTSDDYLNSKEAENINNKFRNGSQDYSGQVKSKTLDAIQAFKLKQNKAEQANSTSREEVAPTLEPFLLNDHLPKLLENNAEGLISRLLKQKGQAKIIYDYLVYLPKSKQQIVSNNVTSSLSELAYKESLQNILEWFASTKQYLGNTITLEFVDKFGNIIDPEEIDLNSLFANPKELIKEIYSCDLLIGLKLCGSEKSIDIEMIKYFQKSVLELSNILKTKTKYLMSDKELYHNIEKLEQLRKKFDKFFVIQINAHSGKVFKGKDIKFQALSKGYRYGYKKLFHLYLNTQESYDLYPRHGFTLMNRYSPGNFELDQLSELETRGVCMVMKPILSNQPDRLLEVMLEKAYDLKVALDGEMNISSRYQSNGSKESIYGALQSELDQYLEAMKNEGIDPGSKLALRLFGY